MKKLKEQMGSVKWDFTSQSVHISESAYFVHKFTAMRYINYGAAVSDFHIWFYMLEYLIGGCGWHMDIQDTYY
nr:abscisic aldehyde oxidase 3 [Tanacetum cinerariifolium]